MAKSPGDAAEELRPKETTFAVWHRLETKPRLGCRLGQ
jgi:hypothetical protein